MRIHQIVASLNFGDAIGNEALHIQRLLREHGIESEIFTDFTDSRMSGRARTLRECRDALADDDVVLLHFSIGSKSTALARELPGKLALVYHNITPAKWFVRDAPKVARQCFRGRRELSSLAERCALAIGVSEFNRRELREAGFPSTAVVPLLHDPERLHAPPNPVTLAQVDDERTNFLFVGRVMPNKCFEDLLKLFKVYQKWVERRSRLVLVGQWRDFERYYERLLGLAERLELSHVEFVGHVSTEDLVAYYRAADLFVCMSEHEGFCAPLLEAFQMRVPVMAYDAGAVAETLDGGGILVHEKRFDVLAELAHGLVHDDALRESVLAAQDEALARAAARRHDEQLVKLLTSL